MSIRFIVGAWRVIAQDGIILGSFLRLEEARAYAIALKSQD